MTTKTNKRQASHAKGGIINTNLNMKRTSILALAYLISFSPTGSSAIMQSVPSRMLLSAKMQAANIGGAILTSLMIDTNTSPNDSIEGLTTNVSTQDSKTAKEVIKSHTGKHGSVCFVVRR